MLTFHVYPKRRLTIIRASGSDDSSAWSALFARIRRDPDYAAGGNWLIVAMEPGADVGGIASEVAAHLAKIEPSTGAAAKCGFVVPGASRRAAGDPLAYAGLSRRFATRTFMSEPAALAWIGWSTSAEAHA